MPEKKHAYLIMAHDQPEMLKKLLHALDDERNDIYLHIDAKSADMEQERFEKAVCRAGLFRMPGRKIVWAGESQILCEMELFKAASRRGYARYHLISGTDFPVCSQDRIHSFFEEHDRYEFIEFWDRPEKEYLYRIRYRYPMQEKIGRYTNDPATVYYRIVSKAMAAAQKLRGTDRVRDYGKEIRCGANWVSVTDEFVRFLLEKQPEIEQFFLQGIAADELYKQTLCWNSPYRENIWPGGNMRLTDWKRGDPYVWQEKDFEEIIHSGALFVRKVSEKNRLADLLAENMNG